MNNTINDNQSTEDGGDVADPAVLRRSFFSKVRDWFTGRTELVPYNYGQPDCPRLKVGDRLIIVSQNEGIDYVAMSCRMSDARYMRKGKHTPWKIVEVFGDGALLCEHKGNRIIDKYLGWTGGNSVGAPHVPFLHSGLQFRVYYERRIGLAQNGQATSPFK